MAHFRWEKPDLAAVKKRAWERRIRAAVKDGKEIAGTGAVYAALQKAMTEYGIAAQMGAPIKEVSDDLLKAADRCLRDPAASQGQLAQTAKMETGAFKQMRRRGNRWPAALLEAAALRSDTDEEIAADLNKEADGAVTADLLAGKITIAEALAAKPKVDLDTPEGEEAVKQERRRRGLK